jgi:RNA polymerase-binding transcription factor DksA
MATTKKVAITKNQKATTAKKAVVTHTAAAKNTPAPTAKTAAATPKKEAVKTAAPKAPAKPAGVTQKVASKPSVTKTAPPDKSVAKKVPEVVAPVEQPVNKKSAAPARTATQKLPDTKMATTGVVADKEKLISKPVENEEIMPVKNNKEDKKEVVAKDASKKPADKVQKTEKAPVKADKPAERSADKKGSKASTLVTYQPEFTKSVLDQPEAPSGPIYRYSDVDLLEFKDLIQKKLEAAKKELVYLQGLITRKDEAGTDDTENKYMSMEDGSGSQEREQLNQMASRQIQFIDHLEKAMIRIENKTYGICRVTGKLIDKARLRAVPHATLSIEAKLAKSK